MIWKTNKYYLDNQRHWRRVVLVKDDVVQAHSVDMIGPEDELFEASTGKFLGVIDCITGEIRTWESDTYLINQEVAAPTYTTFIG